MGRAVLLVRGRLVPGPADVSGRIAVLQIVRPAVPVGSGQRRRVLAHARQRHPDPPRELPDAQADRMIIGKAALLEEGGLGLGP